MDLCKIHILFLIDLQVKISHYMYKWPKHNAVWYVMKAWLTEIEGSNGGYARETLKTGVHVASVAEVA